ncbi:hypothetical protein [Frankia sp. AgKG'84/4]|uniref:hypothetical protein n=1 Tax=Frankia sp. AgKG'84/4 TaxID=573490 RepID=UPI00200D4FE8|nr:hypothetical protein [Frankia sp. AgKG'84/4]MCL9793763.1 hypothetical protein [Frankia sp. AgKG'84/4]
MIWMWEARAAAGRLDELCAWAVDALAGREGEVYLSRQPGGDLVVLILRRPDPTPPIGTSASADGPPLPVPPAHLVAGSAHAWPFEQLHPTR